MTKTRNRWIGLVFISMAISLVIIDGTIVNTIFPNVIAALGLDSTQVQWVQESYVLVFASLLLVWGSLADRVGRRLLLVIGLGIFILAITWTKLVASLGFVLKNFSIVGFLQTFLSLFVAVTGLISQPILMRMNINKDQVIVTHAMQMSVLHGLKVAAFVFAGFAFMDYAQLIIIMITASTAGSYLGGFLRNRISQRVGAILLKAGVTFFGLKMIVDHFIQNV